MTSVTKMMAARRFVVLDRDGTVIVERHYLHDPREVELLPGAAIGLRWLRMLGLGLVVITNQSGIGRGILDAARLELIQRRMCELLEVEGVELDGIYVCPHTPDDDCFCRKPRLGLMAQAAQELGFDPAASFVIGDKACDIDLGRRAGATTLLVRTGYGAEVASDPLVAADYVVDNLSAASQVISKLFTRSGGSCSPKKPSRRTTDNDH